MRGLDERTDSPFSYVDLEDRVPAKHPLRVIRLVVNDVLAMLDGESAEIYADDGRRSIPSERLLGALEQLGYNLRYRWFVGLGVDEPVWVPTVFTKNREGLLDAAVAHKCLAELLNHQGGGRPAVGRALSVDDTQVAVGLDEELPRQGRLGRAAVGQPQWRTRLPREKRSNDTHSSTTDLESRLYRKGKGREAKLSYIDNALTENRHGGWWSRPSSARRWEPSNARRHKR